MDGSKCPKTVEIDALARILRLELKEWEQSFSAAHQGRKAGREDIKQDPEIVRKYKQYDRLRRHSSKLPPPHTSSPSNKRSTACSYSVARPKHAHPISPAMTHSHIPLSPRHLSPRTLRTAIGPTPQKNGQVLGLFEEHSAASDSHTPSKRKPLRSIGGDILTTPSKCPSSKVLKDTDGMHQKSPPGSTKSNCLYDPPTPSTRRIADCSTPTSRRVIPQFCSDDTPAFLRRGSQRTDFGKEEIMGVEGVSWSPVVMRTLPKAAGRSLSALAGGLREMEDEGLDENIDVLREMERDSPFEAHLIWPKILLNDSQRPEMLYGPTGGHESEEDGLHYADNGKGRDGKQLKVWKKKGQRRTTRRVFMKPNTAKWKPEPAWKVDQNYSVEEHGVAERRRLGIDRSTDYGCNSDEHEDVEVSQGTMGDGDARQGSDINLETRKGSAKSVKKRTSATAHANFRALKIKNRQSKVKMSGRFGRKR